ncbi:hypothetical protein [Roseomonas sp. CECT 9278]|uniref:hypothetical protein n=1 Tax=Roseomonas sp. CECT 9278 TaxID=2845823 RepID=UPI001E5CF4A6|nr:hypothetical protein [Roseomonas sp. CECT 9278]CAH0132913.1 hypothetical protein ROS9278_00277 [Roseomonas sp. CECT 9278]
MHDAPPVLLDAALRFADPGTGCAVVVEQCAKACYAYLHDPQGRICADAWLWNVLAAPAEPEWHDRSDKAAWLSRTPFLNPRHLVRDDVALPPLIRAGQLRVTWSAGPGGACASILLDGRLVGRLRPNETPGAALLARADGPLARRLDPGPA